MLFSIARKQKGADTEAFKLNETQYKSLPKAINNVCITLLGIRF